MRLSKPTDLGRDLVRFFEDYLPAQRGLSVHTIRSYRDALLLFLQFASCDTKRPVEQLEIADLTAERVLGFLSFLENERGNEIATRNA
jgi:integrase/recombinase XerD